MIVLEERHSVRVPGGFSFFVQSDYNPQLVTFLHTLKTKYYHKDIHTWEIPMTELSNIIDNFSADIKLKLLDHTEEEFDIPEKEVIDDLAAEGARSEPFDYQLKGIMFGLCHDKWILGDDCGLGKTLQAMYIAMLKRRYCGYKHCLIVCCVNTLKWNWKEEIENKHTLDKCHIIGQKYNKRGKLYVGTVKERIADLKKPIDEYFLITNVETIRNSEITELLLNGPNKVDMLILDEAHKIQTPTSQQGEQILRYSKVPYILPISGTINRGRPQNSYTILKLLGEEKSTYTDYQNYYCEWSDFSRFMISGYKNLEVLKEQITNHMLRRKKSEVLHLPPKLHSTEYVEMSPRQKRVYDEVLADFQQNIDLVTINQSTRDSVFSSWIRLRQATGWTGILSSTIQESAKIERLMELLEEIVGSDQKALVLSNWTSVTDVVERKTWNLYNPSVITGVVKDDKRWEQVNKFQNDDSCKICIGTIGAMGVGLTLTAANYVIFLDEPWTEDDKIQAEDRAHRNGTTGTINVITLVTRDSIDEIVNDIVYRKGIVAKYLKDGVLDMNTSFFLEMCKYL